VPEVKNDNNSGIYKEQVISFNCLLNVNDEDTKLFGEIL